MIEDDFTTLIDNTNREQRRMMTVKLRKKGISDPNLLEAMEFVPREFFVLPSFVNRCYDDTALPISYGQTISQPSTVAFQTQLLQVREGDRILEIGTGSGYEACILKVLGAKVYSVERIEELHIRAVELFKSLRLKVHLKYGDGSVGWSSFAPYNGIIVTAAAPIIPDELKSQLAIGGRLVIPTGSINNQTMHVIKRISYSNFSDSVFGDFRFVPLIGRNGWQ